MGSSRVGPLEVTRVLQAVGGAAFPAVTPLDLWRGDPPLRATRMLERSHHPAVGARVVPRVPQRLWSGATGLRRAAPVLGEHTEEVVTRPLGYSAAELDALATAGGAAGVGAVVSVRVPWFNDKGDQRRLERTPTALPACCSFDACVSSSSTTS